MTDERPASVSENVIAAQSESEAAMLTHMRDIQATGRAVVAGIRTILAAQEQGFGWDPGSFEALAVFREREAMCREFFAQCALGLALVSGRLPEGRVDEALARCGDDAGLFAFLDEMSRVPLGFVDPPRVRPATH